MARHVTQTENIHQVSWATQRPGLAAG
uniref:Uncharacterized protein n=1 Tax=Anguilla anguilla TaxID=7936 RepID=A0A0E9PDI4_ANGAN